MELATFDLRLRTAAQRAMQFARKYVQQFLPDEIAFRVYPNQSFDEHPRVGDEVTFPEESLPRGKYLGPWSADKVVCFLWRNTKVPEWIDVSVEAENGSKTLIGLQCCGRYSAQDDLLYHVRGGLAPFLIKSPVLPPGWDSVESSGKFDLHWQRRRLKRWKNLWYRLTSRGS